MLAVSCCVCQYPFIMCIALPHLRTLPPSRLADAECSRLPKKFIVEAASHLMPFMSTLPFMSTFSPPQSALKLQAAI